MVDLPIIKTNQFDLIVALNSGYIPPVISSLTIHLQFPTSANRFQFINSCLGYLPAVTFGSFATSEACQPSMHKY